MAKIPIPVKSVICAVVYAAFSLVILVVVYIMDLFETTFVLGLFCGIAIAAVAYGDTRKRTRISMAMCIASAAISQLVLIVSGLPYKIILFILRDSAFVQETGRLTVNEVIGYNFGWMLLWAGLLIASSISTPVIRAIKNRRN